MNDEKEKELAQKLEGVKQTMSLLERILEAHRHGTDEERKALEPEMAEYLVKVRGSQPEGSSGRHLINFHFAAQALHDALRGENKVMAAQALSSFIPQFVKVCAVEAFLNTERVCDASCRECGDRESCGE